eukprot:1024359-Amphidinium_carterae.1
MEQSVTVPIKQLAARLIISENQCPAALLVLKSVSNYEALRDGTFPKANFTPGKTRRMKPRARQEDECPDPEFEV